MNMRDKIVLAMNSHEAGARTRAAVDDFEYVDGHTDHIHTLHAEAIIASLPDYDAQQARIEELEAALDRQCDSMAFVLNHMDVKNWYDKFTTELAEGRATLKGVTNESNKKE